MHVCALLFFHIFVPLIVKAKGDGDKEAFRGTNTKGKSHLLEIFIGFINLCIIFLDNILYCMNMYIPTRTLQV